MTISSTRVADQAASIETIISTILGAWSASDLAFVKSGQYDHGMIARRIRNDFAFWSPENVLTAQWHAEPTKRLIVNGIDHSADHPDNIASTIVEAVRARL